MFKYFLWICLALTMFIVLAGCAQPAAAEVSLDRQFTLSPGQSATIVGENLSLKFVEVVSDSRCPKGATCIWAGEASCSVEITKSGSTFTKVLTQPGTTAPAEATFTNYDIAFDLQPYPELGKQTDKNDYHLQLTVSKRSESAAALAGSEW